MLNTDEEDSINPKECIRLGWSKTDTIMTRETIFSGFAFRWITFEYIYKIAMKPALTAESGAFVKNKKANIAVVNSINFIFILFVINDIKRLIKDAIIPICNPLNANMWAIPVIAKISLIS